MHSDWLRSMFASEHANTVDIMIFCFAHANHASTKYEKIFKLKT